MNRRGFLAALLGLAAAPIAAMLPEHWTGFVPISLYETVHPVSDEIGSYVVLPSRVAILNDKWVVRIEGTLSGT